MILGVVRKFIYLLNRHSVHVSSSAARTHLLYAAAKAALHIGQSGDFVEVAVSANEEVERQSQLGEGSPRSTEYDWLIVDLQSATSALSRETNSMPRVQFHRASTSV